MRKELRELIEKCFEKRKEQARNVIRTGRGYPELPGMRPIVAFAAEARFEARQR